jgi:methylenetetrahydrofolate dehydrogenase (NADP+)/methenyltetrahydrofolate cyclohydrolase
MSTLIDGRALAKSIREDLAKEVKEENLKPMLAVILCGDDEASKVYVNIKNKACKEVGIEFEQFNLSKDATEEELSELIEKLNKDKKVNGILLQYPVPKQIDIIKMAELIDKDKDVDGFNPYNIGLLNMGRPNFIPCTPFGIMKMFEKYDIDLNGKKAVVIGRSNVVGKPMAECLLSKNATVTVCHSKTKDLVKELKEADIIIAACGRERIVKADMVKDGAIVIDVGTNRDKNGKLCGDVDFENVKEKASFITPNPGGVGPMTVAMLIENTVKAYKLQHNL